jgi:hypothetical protein
MILIIINDIGSLRETFTKWDFNPFPPHFSSPLLRLDPLDALKICYSLREIQSIYLFAGGSIVL